MRKIKRYVCVREREVWGSSSSVVNTERKEWRTIHKGSMALRKVRSILQKVDKGC